MISATPQVKSSPILFSAPMVKAILDGRKTQTRRIVKPQPPSSAPSSIACEWYEPTVIRKGMQEPGDPVFGFWNEDDGWKCPYGAPGSELWVRESFKTDIRDPLNCIVYTATPEYGKYRDTGKLVRSSFPDGSLPTREESERAMLPKFWKCKPSIHMPRWASRITLQITGVTVERLQAITNADIAAEGIQPIGDEREVGNDGQLAQAGRLYNRYSTMRQLWSELWESINGAGSWSANPWVWVVEFRRVEQ